MQLKAELAAARQVREAVEDLVTRCGHEGEGLRISLLHGTFRDVQMSRYPLRGCSRADASLPNMP